MGRKTVVTRDKYGNTRTYDFHPCPDGLGVAAKDGYTPVVLQALWEDGVVVDWSPDDLTASQRAQLDGFCDDCGAGIRHRQVGPDTFVDECPNCDQDQEGN